MLSRHIVFFNERKVKKERRISVRTSRNRVGGRMKGGSETGSKLLFLKYFSLSLSFSFFICKLYRSIRIVNEQGGEEKVTRVRLQGDVYISRDWA